MALGDRIVVMQKGEIAQIGTPREIYRKPQNPFVADFVGAANRMTGQMRDGRLHIGAHVFDAVDAFDPRHGAIIDQGAVELYFRADGLSPCDLSEAHFTGRVEAVSYLGERLRLTVSGIGPQAVTIDTHADDVIEAGADVHCRVNADRLTVFPAVAAHS